MGTEYFSTEDKSFTAGAYDPSFTNPIYISRGPDGGDSQEERLSHSSNGQGSAHTSDTSMENYLQMSGSVENLCNTIGEGYTQGDNEEGKWDTIVFYEDMTTLREGAYDKSGFGCMKTPLYSSSADPQHYESAADYKSNVADEYITNENFLGPGADTRDDLYLSVNPLQLGLECAHKTHFQTYDYLDFDSEGPPGCMDAEPADSP